MRSTKRHSSQRHRPSTSRPQRIVEALMDDDEVVVDRFQRLFVLGLEVMMLDVPLTVCTVWKLKGRRHRDIDAERRTATTPIAHLGSNRSITAARTSCATSRPFFYDADQADPNLAAAGASLALSGNRGPANALRQTGGLPAAP
jgi:hypothetical protein